MTNLTERRRRPESKVVFVAGFLPCTQELNAWEAQPHSSTDLAVNVVHNVNIPPNVNAILVQALGEDIRYTLSQNSLPSATSGFRLTAGNDPLVIPVDPKVTQLQFYAEGAGARLEMQFGVI